MSAERNLFALCALFAVPLGFGLVSVSTGLKLTNRASHFTRNIASMYRQGVDFARPESQAIVFDLARAQGLPISPDNAVVILSTIRRVNDAVLEKQIVLGNARGHGSRFGAVAGARVEDLGENLREGEAVYAVETWFATADQPTGIYVRSID